jgi:hypothetical protein
VGGVLYFSYGAEPIWKTQLKLCKHSKVTIFLMDFHKFEYVNRCFETEESDESENIFN